jgi:hypothetical protein
MAWMMCDGALGGPDYITVMDGSLKRRQPMTPDARITDQVQVPGNGSRLVVGRPVRFCWLCRRQSILIYRVTRSARRPQCGRSPGLIYRFNQHTGLGSRRAKSVSTATQAGVV